MNMKKKRSGSSIKRVSILLLVLLLCLSSVLSGCISVPVILGYYTGRRLSGDPNGSFSVEGETRKEHEGETTARSGEESEKGEEDPVSAPEDREYNEAFLEFTNEVMGALLAGNTMNIHFFLAEPENFGLAEETVSWGTVPKEEDAEEYREFLDTMEEELDRFDREQLNREEQLTYDSLREYIDTERLSSGLELYYEPLGANSGEQVNIPVCLSVYSFDEEQDVENYLELLRILPEYFRELLDFEERKAEAGLFMEDEALTETIDQCRKFLESREDSFLCSTFEEKIDALGLPEEKAEEYKKRNREELETSVYPAYESLAEALGGMYGRSSTEGGLVYKEKGEAYYRYLLRARLGTSMTPEELIRRIDEEMTECLEEIRSLYARDPFLFSRYQQMEYPSTDPNLLMRILIGKSSEDFPELGEVDYSIRYVDSALRDYLSPACYFLPQADAPAVNRILINCDRGEEDEDIFLTLAHEGYPGHLYQTNYLLENSRIPLRHLLSTSGFSEGWAEYTELLSYRYLDGVSESLREFAALNDKLSLLLYARCDLGIHAEGYGTEEVGELWSSYYEMDEDAVEWIYRYILERPECYLDYAAGMLLIEDLRDRALAEGLSETEFHRELLDLSGASFDLIEEYMFR